MDKIHAVGIASEHKAAIWYMEQGYEVYWPSSSQSKADFVVDIEGVLTKVQVKTASPCKSAGILYLQVRLKSTNKYGVNYKKGDFEQLAIVYKDNLWIIPYDKIENMHSLMVGRVDGVVTKRLRARFNTEEYKVK